MRTFLTSILFAVITFVPVVKPPAVSSETISIPVFLGYRQLQFLIVQDAFKGPNGTAQYLMSDDGCTKITFSEPHLSAEEDLLRVNMKALATIGVPISGACNVITRWSGRATVTGKPVLVSDRPLSVGFRVKDIRLYDQQNGLQTDSVLLEAVKEQLQFFLSRYRLDLTSETDPFKALLPYFAPHVPANRLAEMLDSLRIGRLDIRSNGLDIRLLIDVKTAAKPPPEPVLGEHEMQQMEQRCRSWDSFLTFVIKESAAATPSEELRSALLEILLDARYQITSILTESRQNATDPVKQLFIRTWERLMPLMQDISLHSPERNLLPFLSFITAADALKALDRLGPALELDISTDGLRRLARLLNHDPSIDPLQYLDEIDPSLQQLFNFGMPDEVVQQKKSQSSGFQLIRPVYAAKPRDRLNLWIPTPAELNTYLLEIRKLLLKEANARIRSSSLDQKYAPVYRNLMLAAAWQESCWRQYIVQNRKVVPLISASGDIGILQINERVWRGFYTPSKLRWDIAYNVRAGSEILFKFMVDYALKQKEHKYGGGLTNLARATYSAYNGGPSQVSRYREKNVPSGHKKIDAAFWEKYQLIYRGKELPVTQCFDVQTSSSKVGKVESNKGQKRSALKQASTAKQSQRIENVEWIRSRDPKHFTLQLAAMSDEQAVKKFIQQHFRVGSFAYYRKKQNGRDFYVVLYGSFSNRANAEKAAARFAPLKPWIRDFGSIQKIVLK